MSEPEYLAEVQPLDLDSLGDRNREPTRATPASWSNDALLLLLGSPTIASKRWVYRQYDHMVRTNTLNMPGLGAGVVRIKGTDRALALSVDGNGRYCYLDPYRGAMLAVAEAARNVACAGARPLGATNCLNFGNPERPPIMWQLAKAVEGIGDACRALGVPITGGNVSLYNETDGRPVYPTPVIGVVGLLEHADRLVSRRFQRAGDVIVLLGEDRGELGGSEYLKVAHGLVRGRPPAIDLEAERALQTLLVDLADRRLVGSAHDCSDGGLAVTLAECCFDAGGMGAEIAIDPADVSRDAAMNGRPPSSASPPRASSSRRTWRPSPACWRKRPRPVCRRVSSVGRAGTCCGLPSAVTWRSICRSTPPSVGGRARWNGISSGAWHERKYARQVQGRMRRLWHLRSSRGGQHDLSRPVRAAAPRTGERGALPRRTGRRCVCRARWGMSPTSSTPRRWRACPEHWPSATSAIRPPATSQLLNAQPILIDCAHGQIAIGHNGNLVNAQELRDELVRQGSIFQSNSDTEVVLHLYARSRATTVEDAIVESVLQVAGRLFVS